MIPQPQASGYYDGLNDPLLRAVPPHARRILEVGCASGRLGGALKAQDPSRVVVGVEIDPAAASAARELLDHVYELDIEVALPDLELASLDCVLFGDLLEHLRNPEDVLRRFGELLAPDGIVLVCVPNIQHFTIMKNLLRGDFMSDELPDPVQTSGR